MAVPFLGVNSSWARHLGWIPFFAIAPLAWVLLCAPLSAEKWVRARHSFFLGWIAGVVFFETTLFWISSVAWEGVALLPPFLALYFGFWALFVVMVVRRFFKTDLNRGISSWRSLGAIFLSAAAWVGMEWLRGTLFTGFGWNSFGVSFYQHISLFQFVDITGVAGLSFLGVMTGCMTAIAFQRIFQQKTMEPLTRIFHPSLLRKPGTPMAAALDLNFYQDSMDSYSPDKNPASALPHQPSRLSRRESDEISGLTKSPLQFHGDISLVLLLVVAALIYGIKTLSAPVQPQEPLSVGAVQGNIPQNHKWDRVFEEEIMTVYEKETRLALQGHPDLVVWPEAATPRPLLNDEKIFTQVCQLLQRGHADLLAGSLYYEEHPQRDYNAAILLSPKKEAQVYAKMHLVPFGEYIPFRKTFPLFQWIVGDRVLGDFDAGLEPKVLRLSTKPIGIAPLICFEDTLGDLVRRFALRRAQLLITLTNDGWFGHTVASRQHAMNALFRAAETKLPLLRVANTGVTCVIDRYGRMTQVLRDDDGNTFLEGVLLSELSIPRNPKPTFYTKHGDWFSFLCLGLMGIAILFNLVWRKKLF